MKHLIIPKYLNCFFFCSNLPGFEGGGKDGVPDVDRIRLNDALALQHGVRFHNLLLLNRKIRHSIIEIIN